MYRSNTKRTGVYQTKGIRNLKGIKWELQIDSELIVTPSNVGFNCPLVIADELIYLCDRKGYLYAVNSQTGNEIWKIQIDNAILDNLIFHNNIIYISSSNGGLYAINIKTQQIEWKSSVNFIYNSSPVVLDNLLLVNSQDGNLYAINIKTGQPNWKFKTTENMAFTPPALNDSIVYVGSQDENLYAIDARTGQEKWKCEVGELGLSSIPVVADNVVYIGIKNSILYAINAEVGTEIWRLQVEDTYYLSPLCSPVVDDRFIYVGINVGCLCAINIETQQKSWQKSELGSQLLNSITMAGETIYCERLGAISAVEIETGKDLWKFAAPEPNWSVWKPKLLLPQLMNSFSKKVTGTSLFQFSSPVINDGVIYTYCSNGYLYALH